MNLEPFNLEEDAQVKEVSLDVAARRKGKFVHLVYNHSKDFLNFVSVAPQEQCIYVKTSTRHLPTKKRLCEFNHWSRSSTIHHAS